MFENFKLMLLLRFSKCWGSYSSNLLHFCALSPTFERPLWLSRPSNSFTEHSLPLGWIKSSQVNFFDTKEQLSFHTIQHKGRGRGGLLIWKKPFRSIRFHYWNKDHVHNILLWKWFRHKTTFTHWLLLLWEKKAKLIFSFCFDFDPCHFTFLPCCQQHQQMPHLSP